jgi:hypothetical protein
MRVFLRLIPAVLLALILPFAGGAELRSFTLVTGQTAKATLLGLSGSQVSLILEDGRQVTVDLNQLSQVDQNYVRNNAPGAGTRVPSATPPAPAVPPRAQASPGSLKIAWTKNRIGNKVQVTDKNIVAAAKSEKWKCQFELTNTSRLRLEDLTLHYKVFFRMKSRTGARSSSTYPRTVTGIIKVPAVEGFRSVKMETGEMATSGTASYVTVTDKDGNTYDTGRRELSMEEIEGVKVTVSQGSAEVLRYVSPGMRDTEGR